MAALVAVTEVSGLEIVLNVNRILNIVDEKKIKGAKSIIRYKSVSGSGSTKITEYAVEETKEAILKMANH